MKKTKKAYENYLNELSPNQGSDNWIIGGKIRMLQMWTNKFGQATRKFDPIGFNLGYNEWKNIK